MRMRRGFATFLASFLLASAALGGFALADDEYVSVSDVRVSPASLASDGQVAVTVNVAVDLNRTDGGITNVYIDGDAVEKPAPVTPGIQIADNQDIGCTLNVKASQLGQNIPLAVRWDGGSQPFTVRVNSSAPAAPQVSFTRYINTTSVEKGGTVSLLYRVQNTGAMDITNLSFSDEGIDSGALKTKDVLSAGDSYEFTYDYTVNADFTSAPKLTYKANGTAYTATCAPKTVTLKMAQLDALLEASPATVASGGEALLQCTVTNSGNVSLSNVVIGDATLGSKLFPAFSVAAGAPPKYFAWDVALTQTTKFQFVLTAKDDSGNTYTFKSNEIEVAVSPANGQYDVGFTASADAVRLGEPGQVNFSFKINNRGTAPIAGASIVDQNGALIKAFDSLPMGETSYAYSALADKTQQYNFCLVIPNGDGTNFQAFTGTMQIEVAESSTAPGIGQPTGQPTAGSTDAAASGNSSPGKMDSLIAAMLVVGVLIAVTIIVLITLIISDKRKKKR